MYKSGRNAYHPVSKVVVLVTSEHCGDGYSESHLYYAAALASFLGLGFYLCKIKKNRKKLLGPSSVCLPAL